MNNNSLRVRVAIALVLAAVAAPGALADKPEWAGKGKGGDEWHDKGKGKGGDERHDKGKGKGHDKGRGEHGEHFFSDRHRVVVHDYYGEAFRSGRCPPGLAKKHNGCMPPGQAKKWRIGRPLPREVVYYPVPQDLIVRLGPPPSGYRYVRVEGDILLLAIGTAIVVDALQNLGRQ
jgi:Ni/Co efflux regulator RcnB